MRILVCGGRDYRDYQAVALAIESVRLPAAKRVAENCPPPPHTVIIHGGARGADEMAALWARSNKCAWVKFDADWKQYGKAAGPIRNQKMIDEGKPDVVIAAPGGTGTADMVRRARAAKIKVIEIEE